MGIICTIFGNFLLKKKKLRETIKKNYFKIES